MTVGSNQHNFAASDTAGWDEALARYLAARQAAAADPLQFKGGVSAELEEERIALIGEELSAAFDNLAATQPTDGNALAAKLEAFAFQREDIPMGPADFAVLARDARGLSRPAIGRTKSAVDIADRAGIIADYIDLLLRQIWSKLEDAEVMPATMDQPHGALIADAQVAIHLAQEMVQRLNHLDAQTS